MWSYSDWLKMIGLELFKIRGNSDLKICNSATLTPRVLLKTCIITLIRGFFIDLMPKDLQDVTRVKQRDMDYILYTTNASASIFIFYSAHLFSLWTIEATELYKRLSDQRASRKYQMHLNSISRHVRIRSL